MLLSTCHGLPLQGLNITNYLVGALDAITARELLRQDVHTFNMYEDGAELPAGQLTGSQSQMRVQGVEPVLQGDTDIPAGLLGGAAPVKLPLLASKDGKEVPAAELWGVTTHPEGKKAPAAYVWGWDGHPCMQGLGSLKQDVK